jgi:hypothetical protein
MKTKLKMTILFVAAALLLGAAVTTTRTYNSSGSGPTFEIYPMAVPTSSMSDVVTGDVRVNEITLTNTTGSAITVTVQDKQTSPQAFLSAISVGANSTYVIETPSLRLFPGGVSWQASGAGIVGYVSWR